MKMKSNLSSRDRADIMKDQGFSYKFGKWFRKGAPITQADVKRELLSNPIYQAREMRDERKAEAYFIAAYGEE